MTPQTLAPLRALSHNLTLFALLAALTLAAAPGCASLGGAREAAANVLVPPSEEARLGEQMAAQVEQELRVHPNQNLQAYVDLLGSRVVAEVGDVPEAIDFTFTVIDAPDVINAMALPGGHVYVFSGLLLAADNEAEIMSVLAHEVAHVTERHIAERLVTVYGLQTVQQLLLGGEPGVLGQLISGIVANGYMLKYSRDQETEADLVGLDYLVDAGYNPYAMVSFFDKLRAQGGGQTPEILASHPNPETRMNTLVERIRGFNSPPTYTGAGNLDQYQRMLTAQASNTQTPQNSLRGRTYRSESADRSRIRTIPTR